MADTKYVTLEELAEHVGVKVSTVRQWVKRGFVPRSTYIKAGNTYRFCVEDVVIALRKEEPEEAEGQHEEQPESAKVVTKQMLEDLAVDLEQENKPRKEPNVEEMLSELDDDF